MLYNGKKAVLSILISVIMLMQICLPVSADSIAVVNRDSFVDKDGKSNLRFITEVILDGVKEVEKFGTWIVPQYYLDKGDELGGDTTVTIENTDAVEKIKLEGSGKFKADLMGIPAGLENQQFFAKSFIVYKDTSADVSDLVSSDATSTEDHSNTEVITYTPEPTATPVPYAEFSKVFPHTDTYLYRVGNSNNVTLSSLFAQKGSIAPANVSVTITKIDGNAAGTYTSNATWNNGTLKFTGTGVVKVTIKDGSGTPTDLYLEVVDGNNLTSGTISSTSNNVILLGNVTVVNGEKTTFSNNKVYGNGYTMDASGGLTTNHGIIEISSTTLDNLVITGPVYSKYEDSFGNTNFASTVAVRGNSIISNCRITNAASPLRVLETAKVENTVLSGGVFANLELRMSANVTVENLTTINSNGLGIVFYQADTTSKITINGELNQHNFINQNTSMSNDNASTLKSKMFGSTYSKYQFTSGGVKYINTGIISMSDYVQSGNIVDNRTNKKNYSGMDATISVLSVSVHGYVYTMENTDSSMLETSYTEPAYTPSTQIPYEPVYNCSLGSQAIAAGGNTHCYEDSSKNILIQFPQGDSFTLDAAAMATVKKYSTHTITPTVTCKNSNDTAITVTNGKITFTEAGTYTIYYTYTDSNIYNKNGVLSGQSKTYTKTAKATVNVKKVGKNAKITVTSNTGTMIWGGAGSSFDRDYQPAAPIFDAMTIVDYDDDGNEYTVLDGSNQSAFLSKIASVTADSDNKTGFTIAFPDGTSIAIKNGAPYNSGTLEFKKYNNKFYMCGSKAYNNPTAATWSVTSYTYTGRNGVAVSYTTKRSFTSTTTTDYVSLSSLSSNKFLIYNLNGGTMSGATYTSTSPATLPTPTREGFAFKGWNTKEDGTGTMKAAGTSYSFSSTTTLYAQWFVPSVVTFNANGGTCATASATNESGDITLPDAANGSMTFEGWYDAASGGNKIGKAGDTYDPTGDITLYAHWSNKIKVTFNANSGSCSTDELFYDPAEGTGITLPTATRTGYTFNGWYTATSGGTQVNSPYKPSAAITLYAQWTVNTYTVTISAGSNGSVDKTSITGVPYNTSISTSSNTLTINGTKVTATANKNYSFDKWSVSNGDKVTGAMTITASFKSSGSTCVVAGTLITMADGTQKTVENIENDEMIISFDHETGKFVSTPIIAIVNHGEKIYNVVKLSFSDGTELKFIEDHGLFDLEENEYVSITPDNCNDFIGHRFVQYAGDESEFNAVTLTKAQIVPERTESYSIWSYINLNSIANGMLTLPTGLHGTFNYFKYDSDLKYNVADKNKKIQNYGLYTFNDWKEHIPYELYDGFSFKYFKPAIAEGLVDYDTILYYINWFYDIEKAGGVK